MPKMKKLFFSDSFQSNRLFRTRSVSLLHTFMKVLSLVLYPDETEKLTCYKFCFFRSAGVSFGNKLRIVLFGNTQKAASSIMKALCVYWLVGHR
jgi:hypothetical protein